MIIQPLALPEVRLLSLEAYADDRGHFMELWRADTYADAGFDVSFVQDNLSVSARHVLRGLHFQYPQGQAKLVTVLQGRVFDVVVDVRRGSPRFGQWVSAELSAETPQQLFVPAGFAHGFMALTDEVHFHYKCSRTYAPAHERSIRWDDPRLGIDWPVEAPTLSAKDAAAPMLNAVPASDLPRYDASPDHNE